MKNKKISDLTVEDFILLNLSIKLAAEGRNIHDVSDITLKGRCGCALELFERLTTQKGILL